MAWTLFFDGDCTFCSASVRQVVRFDRQAQISFASLQGKLSHEKGFTHYADPVSGTMVLLREADGKVFTQSDSLIQLARIFGGPWRILTLAHFIPKSLRDGIYRFIARNRHLLMGKSAHCKLPDQDFLRRLRD